MSLLCSPVMLGMKFYRWPLCADLPDAAEWRCIHLFAAAEMADEAARWGGNVAVVRLNATGAHYVPRSSPLLGWTVLTRFTRGTPRSGFAEAEQGLVADPLTAWASLALTEPLGFLFLLP